MRDTQQNFRREGFAPWFNPLPFNIPVFRQKRYWPFRIPFNDEWCPFHITSLQHSIPFMHQSIPPAPSPPPPRANPRELAFFSSWMANSRGREHLSCQMPGGGDESRGRMPRPRDRFNASFHFRTLQ